MEQQIKTSKLVRKILAQNENARKNYEYLIDNVYETILPGSTKRPHEDVSQLIRDEVLPSARTIERAYRECVRKNPELKDDLISMYRQEKAEKYRLHYAEG